MTDMWTPCHPRFFYHVVPVVFFALVYSPSGFAADRIVLRNLDIIADRTVAGFDEDGVRLDDSSLITWDQIERGKVASDTQAAFDGMLQDLGTHLYRIRQRLTVGDYRDILPHAEAVYPRYVGRKSETAYMVFQALMWARLAVGRRELAVEPYLRCFDYLRSTEASKVSLPGDRRLRYDPATGMTPDLQPVWFDAGAAKSSLGGVLRAVTEMQPPRPEGTRVYYGTLALAAGEADQAIRVLSGIEGKHPAMVQLRGIAMAQREVAAGESGTAISTLEHNLDKFAPANKPLAIYWLGTSKLKNDDERVRRKGILRLLHLPAIYGKQFPELAAAGLYEAMRAFAAVGDDGSCAAVRRELLDQYGQTYHAAKVKAELSPKSDP
jgi:hypothetical protein